MIRTLLGVVLALGVSAGLAPAAASADDMDITLSRLRVPVGMEGCMPGVDFAPDPMGNDPTFCPDNQAWQRLVSQFGAILAPPVMTPARTVGYGGFYLGAEGWLGGIDSNADYWRRGTEGDGMDDENRFVDSTLIWYRLFARKGFPFGFELGTSLARMLNTDLWAWGLEVRWALFEGFRTGIGILPDVSVRGAVYTMTGEWEFNVTVPTLDILVSKPIVLARTGTISPYLGMQIVWILGDSELVDLTPETRAFETCVPAPGGAGVECTGGDGGMDYANHAVFRQVRATRYRGVIGFQGRYRAFTLTGAFQFDLVKPGDADSSWIEGEDAPTDLPRQWTVSTGLGLTF